MHIIKFCFFYFFLLLAGNSYAYLGLEDYESSRTKANAGAGIASVLLNESTLLNPASIYFLKNSSFYYQNDSADVNDPSEERAQAYRESDNKLFAITDTSSPYKGGVSYQYQREDIGKRIRYSVSLSKNIGKKSSMGVIYRYSEESTPIKRGFYNQFVIGLMHIHSEKLVLAATVVDPNQKISEYFKYTFGLQYSFNRSIDLIIDAGSGDVENYEDEAFIKWAIQLQSFERFFFRYGRFHDKFANKEGVGFGVSWVGPKFSLDYSLKTAEIIEDTSDTLLKDETIKETSIGFTFLM